MEKYAEKSSNWVEKLKTVLNLLPFLFKMWELSEVKLKEKIQKLIYPMGMRFHKEKEAVLTEKVNELYSRLALSTRAFNEKGELSSLFLFTLSHYAEKGGLLYDPVEGGGFNKIKPASLRSAFFYVLGRMQKKEGLLYDPIVGRLQ